MLFILAPKYCFKSFRVLIPGNTAETRSWSQTIKTCKWLLRVFSHGKNNNNKKEEILLIWYFSIQLYVFLHAYGHFNLGWLGGSGLSSIPHVCFSLVWLLSQGILCAWEKKAINSHLCWTATNSLAKLNCPALTAWGFTQKSVIIRVVKM